MDGVGRTAQKSENQSMRYLPKLIVSEEFQTHPAMPALDKALRAAIKDVASFWPANDSDHGDYYIEVVKGDSIVTFQQVQQLGGIPTHIVKVGVDWLSSPAVAWMTTAQRPIRSTVAHALAHETFHLGEFARMRKCSIPDTLVNSGFAKGVFKHMPTRWTAAAGELATLYPERAAMPPMVQSAADIVSELMADLRGIDAVRKLDPDWQAFAQALQGMRANDEAADPNAYKISGTFANLMGPGLPSQKRACETLWEKCFASMAQSPHSEDVDAALAARGPFKQTAFASISRFFGGTP